MILIYFEEQNEISATYLLRQQWKRDRGLYYSLFGPTIWQIGNLAYFILRLVTLIPKGFIKLFHFISFLTT